MTRWPFAHALGLTALLLASGCDRNGPGLLTGYDFMKGYPNNAAFFSSPVLLMADTHVHHLFGDPVFTQTNLADSISSTAVRTPQADLYAKDVLTWFLDQYQGNMPVIHLGDALDASCTDEFETFFRVMRGPGDRPMPPWFMAPGNHDGYFYGSSHEDSAGGAWLSACANGSRPLTKAEFVRAYLDAVGEQEDPGARALRAHRKLYPRQRFTGELKDERVPGAMLIGAAWQIRPDKPWQSYVIQKVHLRADGLGQMAEELPKRRVIALLIDTSSYELQPQTIPVPPIYNVGLTGDLGPSRAEEGYSPQEEILFRWADDARREGAVLVLMGHHDYASLTSRAQRVLHRLHREHGAVLYVSAHQHDGRWLSIGADHDTWPELNVGSMVDDPIEYREFSFRYTKDGRVAVVAPLYRLGDLRTRPPCEQHQQGWEASVQDADYYLSYKLMGLYRPIKTQQQIVNVMLASYRRMFSVLPYTPGRAWPAGLPSGPELLQRIDDTVGLPYGDEGAKKLDLLRQIVAAEAEAPFADPALARIFKVCQAYWGSKYETRGARLPATWDWTVLYPRQGRDVIP